MDTYGDATGTTAAEIDEEYKALLEEKLDTKDEHFLSEYTKYGINTPRQYLLFADLYLKKYKLFQSEYSVNIFFKHIFFLITRSESCYKDDYHRWYLHEENDIGNIIYLYRHNIVDKFIHTITDDTYYAIYDHDAYKKLIEEEVDRICASYPIDADTNNKFRKSFLQLLGDPEGSYVRLAEYIYDEIKYDAIKKLSSEKNLEPFKGAYEALGVVNDWEYICYQVQNGKITGSDEILKVLTEAVTNSVNCEDDGFECHPHIKLLSIYFWMNHSSDEKFSLNEEILLEDDIVDTIMTRKMVLDVIDTALFSKKINIMDIARKHI